MGVRWKMASPYVVDHGDKVVLFSDPVDKNTTWV